MSSERCTLETRQAASLIASGLFPNERSSHHASMVSLRGGGAELSYECLARHLVEVALLAQDERDFRLAEHLIDVTYHLASGEAEQ